MVSPLSLGSWAVLGSLAGLSLATALPPIGPIPPTGLLPPVETITLFQLSQNFTWFENLAFTDNGNIVATRADVPEVWLIDPTNKNGSKLVSVPGVASVTGIAKVAPDVFIVNGGNFSIKTGVNTKGSWQFFQLNLTKSGEGEIKPITKRVPGEVLLNGMTVFDDDNVLVANSYGSVYKVNWKNGAYDIQIKDDTMAPPAGNENPGINGLHMHNGYLYYDNSANSTFMRVPLDRNASANGIVETIATGIAADDFTIEEDGTAFLAGSNGITRVATGGQHRVVVGGLNSTVLAGATSCKFGSRKEGKALIVTANGACTHPVNGNFSEPAFIAAVDLGGW